jgi:triacylglycerol lipase
MAHPVILVHGVDDTVARLNHLEKYLESGGLAVHCFNLVPNHGEAPLAELAQQLASYVQTNFAAQEALDLMILPANLRILTDDQAIVC